MKQLKFDHVRAQRLQSDQPNYTLRLVDDKDLKAGDTFTVVDKTTADKPQDWQIVGEGTITETSIHPIEEIKKSDGKLGDFEDAIDLLAVYRQSLGGEVTSSAPIKLVTFSYRPYEDSVSYFSVYDKQPYYDVKVAPKVVQLYADGGSRGNPGPSALGYVMYDEDKSVLNRGSKYLGITTNNQAEYHALKAGLEWCKEKHVKKIDVFMDSLLVVNQMKGVFKVRNRDLWPLHDAIKKLTSNFEQISFSHVPRELNKAADAEVNKALDALEG